MRNKLIIIFVLLVATNLNILGFDKKENWFRTTSKIKIGESTKQQVETLFNSPKVDQVNKFKGSEIVYYETKLGGLNVTYSLGRCEEVGDKYDFEKGMVMSFSFSPFKPISASKLKLDLRNFQSEKENDNENWNFFNNELGIIYGLANKKLLTYMYVSMSELQEQKYLCQDQ